MAVQPIGLAGSPENPELNTFIPPSTERTTGEFFDDAHISVEGAARGNVINLFREDAPDPGLFNAPNNVESRQHAAPLSYEQQLHRTVDAMPVSEQAHYIAGLTRAIEGLREAA